MQNPSTYRTLSVDVTATDPPEALDSSGDSYVTYPVFLDTFSMNMRYEPDYFPHENTTENLSSEFTTYPCIVICSEL